VGVVARHHRLLHDLEPRRGQGSDVITVTQNADMTWTISFTLAMNDSPYTDDVRILLDYGTAFAPNVKATVTLTGYRTSWIRTATTTVCSTEPRTPIRRSPSGTVLPTLIPARP
jgi:hypothetical protein